MKENAKRCRATLLIGLSLLSVWTFNAAKGSTECTDGSWRATSTDNAPANRYGHSAIWTGTEMIVWGGTDGGYLATGGRYNPSTDTWVAISTNGAPEGRVDHTAVWTGTEMIVWGGDNDTGFLATGGRYNPSTDSWVATNGTNAPSTRAGHTAVWTGTEMIVWGGTNGPYLASGGRYNPSTDSWLETTNDGAPQGRIAHTAVWTGTEMIIWGGGYYFNSGGRYNPETNSWVPTNTVGAPFRRNSHIAVWTGTEMIVWGGNFFQNGHPYYVTYFNRGGRYNPSTDSWVETITNGAPFFGFPTAVWTGTEMIVWETDYYQDWNTNRRYSPSYYNWTSVHVSGELAKRTHHSSAWTGTEFIFWGGLGTGPSAASLNTGGRYCVQSAPPRLGNISTRLAVGTADNALIGGFIITGAQTKRVIIRALGPSVPVPNHLADPVLELHQSDGQVIINYNWRDLQEAEIIASGKVPPDDAESAIIMTLAPGAYTAIVRGNHQTTGVALMEVWDLDSKSSSTMSNVSTRGFVQTGDNVLIGGTIIEGGSSANILVRAIGPSLTGFGLPNALEDPTLELHDRNGAVLALNDNWRDTQEVAIQATGRAPSNDFESAIVRTFAPGEYTAIVRGNNESSGVALVEVYALP